MSKLLSKKVISLTAGIGVAVAIAVPIGLGIKNATTEHKYNDYKGTPVIHTSDLKVRTAKDGSERKIPEITAAFFDFGNEQFAIPELKAWQKNIAASDDPEKSDDENKKLAAKRVVERKELAKKIDARFESVRKSKGINPTLVIQTKIMIIKNNYFDIFGWGDTTDFFDWFINDVSWGPDLLTLREFDIVRGVSKDGSMITLGGHSGTRESTMIKFYPDSFFGVQNIYDGSDKSILVDTSNLPLATNKDIIRSYTKPFIDKLAKFKDKLFADDFESDKELEDEILNIKNLEDYVEIFDSRTILKLSGSPLIEGSTSDKEAKTTDGGFALLTDFVTYVHGKGQIVDRDTIKESNGNVKVVYPKRYLRRLFSVMYGYVSNGDLEVQDVVRKRIETNTQAYSNYFGTKENAFEKLNAIIDGSKDTTLEKTDGTNIQDAVDSYSTPDDVVVKPYSESVNFDSDNIEATYTDKDQTVFAEPLIYGDFKNFNADLPANRAPEIGKIIKQITKMNVARAITSANKGVDGKNKVSLLFEKYQNLIDTIAGYRKEHNWAPVSFYNGKPNLNEFIPNLYLYKYQNREHGFLDYVASAAKGFDTDEKTAAKFVSEEIAKYKIDFNKEIIDINDPKTTREPGDVKAEVGTSYDNDLAKVLKDVTSGVEETLVKKYFEYEARSKTKVKSIGIEWLKYVASHEYGHHQTLTYAKDLGATDQPSKKMYDGIYETSHSEIVSGATINAHSFQDTYSRHYLNSYLRARSGVISDLNPEDADKNGKRTIADDIAVMQINAAASKDDPYYTFLFNNKNHNRFTTDETSTTQPVEKGIYTYADFLNSWRAFKNPSKFLEALQIKPEELAKLRAKLDGESNIGYVAYLLNALDQSSYSLNPTVMAPEAPFVEGTNRAIDPGTTDSGEAAKINPLNIINGWTGYYGTDASISPSIKSLLVDEDLGYKTTLYKNGANPDDALVDRLDIDPTTKSPKKYSVPVPTVVVDTMMDTVSDIDDTTKKTGGINADLFLDENILAPAAGGNPYAVSAAISKGVKSINNNFAADFRKANDFFVTLKVDYSAADKKPHYYLPGDIKAPATAKLEKVFVSSMTFQTVPLVGIMRESVNAIISAEYNAANGEHAWDNADPVDRQKFFEAYLVRQLNADGNRKLAANLPIQQLASGKKTYTEWFEKGFGMDGIPASQNAVFKKSYGEYLFQTYFKNFGRFLEFEKEYKTGSSELKVAPTTYLVTTIGTAKAKTNKLNDVYASFLSQGSYSFFGQMMADYQVNLPETINRDLNQLIYSASTEKLQDGVSSEAYDGLDYSLPPIFTSTYGENGRVSFVPDIGSYSTKTKTLSMSSKKSGFFEDLALRRETDSSLYMLDEGNIEEYYRKAIKLAQAALTDKDDKTKNPDHYNATGELDYWAKYAATEHYDDNGVDKTVDVQKVVEVRKFVDTEGNPITNPDDWHKAFDGYGHPLTTTGKAMVNFYKDTSGAVTDRDLSGFFVDKYTGMGKLFGYLSEKDLDVYDHIAFVGTDGSVKYIGITKHYSNQFFHKVLGVTGEALEGQKVAIGKGYFDTEGKWVEYTKEQGGEQIGWASDTFLADSYANALMKEGISYKMVFTHGKSLDGARDIELGSLDMLSASSASGASSPTDDTDAVYELTHGQRQVMYNNGYDVYSGKFEITKNQKGETILRVRRANDE